jgi:hypothetical protein
MSGGQKQDPQMDRVEPGGRSGVEWLVVLLAGVEAGWMAADGTRALVTGDYRTPASGRSAGQLGPWAGLVKLVGIPPRSTLMKAIFVAYGLAWLAVTAAFVRGRPWARKAMVVAAAGSTWYLGFGTASSAAQLLLLAVDARAASRRLTGWSGRSSNQRC